MGEARPQDAGDVAKACYPELDQVDIRLGGAFLALGECVWDLNHPQSLTAAGINEFYEVGTVTGRAERD